MAIDRLWQSGAESRSPLEISTFNGAQIVSVGRGGGYCYQLQLGIPERMYQTVSALATTRQIRGGLAIQRVTNVPTNDYELFAIEDIADNPLVELMVDFTNEELVLKVAGVQQDITIGNAWPNDLGVWKYLTYDVYIHNAAGWVEIYLEGNNLLSFAGNTGNVDIDELMFGSYQDAGGGDQYTYFDDLYLDNTDGEGAATSPPVLKFEFITPDGNGNYDQWIGSDGNNVDNYLLVDDRPPNATDFVEEDTVDQFDSYTMTTYVLGASEMPLAVIPIAFAQRIGSLEEIALGTRYSAVDVIGSDQDPGSGRFSPVSERQITKPGGGDWDQASITGLEVVLKSRGTF